MGAQCPEPTAPVAIRILEVYAEAYGQADPVQVVCCSSALIRGRTIGDSGVNIRVLRGKQGKTTENVSHISAITATKHDARGRGKPPDTEHPILSGKPLDRYICSILNAYLFIVDSDLGVLVDKDPKLERVSVYITVVGIGKIHGSVPVMNIKDWSSLSLKRHQENTEPDNQKSSVHAKSFVFHKTNFRETPSGCQVSPVPEASLSSRYPYTCSFCHGGISSAQQEDRVPKLDRSSLGSPGISSSFSASCLFSLQSKPATTSSPRNDVPGYLSLFPLTLRVILYPMNISVPWPLLAMITFIACAAGIAPLLPGGIRSFDAVIVFLLQRSGIDVGTALTLGNLLLGTTGILLCLKGFDCRLGAACILGDALMDSLDVWSARRLKAESTLGKELDSLSDLVSFGVAPVAMLCAQQE